MSRLLILVTVLLAFGYQPALAKETSEDRPVGSLGGAVHADPFTGVATTSIPIEVPPGRNGMQPNLALTYNSANGNGWLGMGWELAQEGIYRQTKWGVDYTNNVGEKAFVVKMAGVTGELVPTPPPAPSSQWSAKIEGGFSRIEKLTAGDGQIMWKVTTKQGRKHYFGQSSASRQVDPANAGRIFGWLLDRVEDSDGNYMTYSYWADQANNQVYLDHIDYAGNGVTAPTNQVKFWRDDGSRPDQADMYTTDYRIKTKYRIKTIEVTANGSMTRAHKLNYDPGLQRSLLTTIQQFGKDVLLDSGTITNEVSFPLATRLPASAITYQGSGSGNFDVAWSAYEPANPFWRAGTATETFPGDFNGDGKTDFLQIMKDYYQARVLLARSDGSGQFDVAWSAAEPVNPFWRAGTGTDTFPGDFNGDGKTDFLQIMDDYYQARVLMARSDGSGNFDVAWSAAEPINPFWRGGSATDTFPGDFNGDGKTDFLQIMRDYYQARVLLATGNGNFQVAWSADQPTNPFWRTGRYATYPGDFNGDGNIDFVQILDSDYQAQVLTGKGDGTFAVGFSGYYPAVHPIWRSGAYTTLIADISGDGKFDILQINNDQYQAQVLLSNGPIPGLLSKWSNGLGGATTITYDTSSNDTNNRVPFALQRVKSITTCDHWNSTTSTCAGTSSTTSYAYSGGFYHLGERDLRGVKTTMVTSPGATDADKTVTITWFHQGNELTPIDTEDPLAANGYMKGMPYRVEVRRKSDNYLFSKTETTYLADQLGSDTAAPWFTPVKQVDTTIENGAKTTRVLYADTDFVGYDAYGNVTQTRYLGDVSTSSDDSTTVITFGNYDPTNWLVAFPTVQTTHAGLGSTGAIVWQTKTWYDGSSSCTSPNGTLVPTKGHITKIERYLASGSSPISGMEYNASGGLTCTRDPNGNVTTLAYDATGTFPVTSTNALGHVTTTVYYGVNGVPMDTGLSGQVKALTDPNGQTTTTTYDALGRLVTTTTPDGLVTTKTYNYGGTFGVGTQHIQTTVSGGGLSANLVSKTYFDGLGRTIKKENPGAADGGGSLKVLVTETQYDTRGLVKQTSLPYLQGSESAADRWRAMTYDALGRTIDIQLPDNTHSKVCYNGWTTTTIDPKLHKKVETKDAYGRLVTVQEYTGTMTNCVTDTTTLYATTTYQYDLLGNLLSVTDTKGNVSSMTYDMLGRKLTMHDPDMGNWSYTYDANGNLLTQVDAKNQKLCFSYDALNRRTQKNYGTTTQACGTNTVVYTYDDTVYNRKGRLKQVTDPAQTVSFQYDVRGRISRTDKTLDGVTYTTQSTYDGLGRLLTVSYPTTPATTVSYEYDGPQLKRVYEGGATYVTYSGWNALSQPSIATAGNGVVTTSTYANSSNAVCSQQTFRLCTVKIQKGTNPLYQDLTYNFEANGNVAGITDAVSGNQTFVYDELDRLATANGPYGTFIYTYDEIGNLTSNPQLGLYTYPDSGPMSVRPHAVTAAGNTSYSYDANGNMTSGGGRTYTWNPENKPLTIAQGTPPPNGQQAAFAFAEGSGTVTADATGHNNTGTLSGVTWTAAGKNGSGLSFDGTNGYVQVPDSPGLNISGSGLTVSFWAKLIDRNDGTDQVLLSKPWWTLGSFDSPYHHYAVEYDDNGGKTADFYFGDTTGQQRGPFSMPVTARTWTHIAFTYNGAEVKGYVNGVLQLTVAETSVIQARGQAILLGVDGSYNQAAKGTLDDVRIYSRALSQAEIQADMNTPVAPGPPQTTTFVYDGDGGRVKKIVGTTTTRYISKLYECDTTGASTTCSRFIWAGNTRIATIANNGTVHYWHGDHLGSSSVITDSTGAKVQALTYYPYGATRSNQSFSSPMVDVPYKYTGKELDNTSLYYYEARYYDPALARFISADTIVSNPRDPQNLNRYSYVENNPLKYIDPTGHFKIKFSKFIKRATDGLGDVGRALVGIAIQTSSFGVGDVGVGSAIMSQSKTGRYMLAGEVIAATAAATFYCGGCGANFTIAGTTMYTVPAAATVGAIGTGTLGGISAANAGGDISSGVLVGTAMGAVAGAANGYLGSGLNGLIQPGDFSWTPAFFGKAATAGLLNMTGGAILNGASGAAIGYAGGRGDWNDMLRSAGRSIASGAKTDAATTLLGLAWDAKPPSIDGYAFSFDAEIGWDVGPLGSMQQAQHVHVLNLGLSVSQSQATSVGNFFKIVGGNAPQWDELGRRR